MDFERKLGVGKVKLEHPIMNGPGHECKTIEEVERLVNSMSSAVMVGAITKDPRSGNPGDVAFFDIPHLSSNSLGMPNRGLAYYRDEEALPKMVEMAHAEGKPLFVNVSGFSKEEFVELAVFVEKSGADGVQLNLSCPNIHDKGKKRIFCFDLKLTQDILEAVCEEANSIAIVDAKLSPMSDPVYREEMAHLMKELAKDGGGVNAVTLCNTFPNVMIYRDDLRPVIHSKLPNNTITMGGMGGPAMKPIALAHVELFRSILEPWQDIVGIGGVQSGRDVLEYEEAGANIVQITTAHAVRGRKVFDQIVTEYMHLKTA